MELKNYFKKFGVGWIAIGLVLSFIFILYEYFFSENEIGLGYIISLILSITYSFYFIFIPFLLGFFGLLRIFYLIIGWEALYLFTAFLSHILSRGAENLPPYPIIILFPLVLIVGIIWEIIYYHKQKKIPFK